MNALIVRDESSVSFTPQAAALKEAALESSALIAIVRNEEDQRVAVDAQRMIKTLLAQAEAARVAVKQPVLELGREIDARAKEFTQELKEEEIRLSTTIGDYQQEQLMIARRAELQRQIELRKIEDEKAAAIAIAAAQAAAEVIQRQAELLQLGKVRHEPEDGKAAVEALTKAEAYAAELMKAEIVKQDELATQKIEMLARVPLPAKANGQAVRQPFRWELVNMDLLYKMHPGLVTMTTNAREINETILRLAALGGEPQIKGLRIWQETVSGVRLGRERKAIDV